MAGLDVVGLALPHRELVNSASIASPLQAATLGLVLLQWLCLAWFWYWWCTALHGVRRKLPQRFRCTVDAVGIAFPAAAGGWYLTSLGFYVRSGVFPDLDVLRFSAINAGMLLRYFIQAEPTSLLTMLGLGFAAAVGSAWAFRQQQSSCAAASDRGRSGLIPGLLVFASFANLLVALSISSEPKSLSVSRPESFRLPQPPLSAVLRYRVSPPTSIALSLVHGERASRQHEIPVSRLVPREEFTVLDSALPSRPNVILVVVESLRHDVVGLTHQGQEVMPQLNRLARNGLHFTRCYTQSVHSDYADPCFASSLYPLRSAQQYFYSTTTPWPKVLLWDVLQPRGYATSLISSQNEAWSNMHLFYASPGLDRLFDSRSAPQFASARGDEILKEWTVATTSAGKLDDEFTRRTACQWIAEQVAAGRPFCSLIILQTSHFPYELPSGAAAPFEPGTITFDASLFGFPPERVPVVRNAYFNALHYVDRQLGAIRQELERLGIASDTILAVVGDHGEAFYENGECGHAQSLLETVTRVPLVFYAPGRLAVGVDDYLTQAIDVPATLVKLAGAGVPAAFQGIDVLDPHRPPPASRVVFQHSRAGGRGADSVVSDGGWKFVEEHDSEQGRLQWRPTDLGPEADVAARFPETAACLQKLLRSWRSQQISYHRWPRYYSLFYAPRTPALTEEEIDLLRPSGSAKRTASPDRQSGSDPEQ